MNRKDIKSNLIKSFSKLEKNDYSKVIAKINNNEGEEVMLEEKKVFYGRYALATCLIIILCLFGLNLYKDNKVVTTIDLDINPSLEVLVNEKNEVVKVIPKNDDAKELLVNVKVKGYTYDVAVDVILNKVIEDGYINETKNTVLVTVIDNDLGRSEEVKVKVENTINQKIVNDVSVVVISQIGGSNQDAESLANANHTTVGKVLYVNKIMEENNNQLAFNDLIKLSIGELNVIVNKGNVFVGEVINDDPKDSNVNVDTNDPKVDVNVNKNDTKVNVDTNDTKVDVDVNKDKIEVNVNDQDLLSETIVKVIVLANAGLVNVNDYTISYIEDNDCYSVRFQAKNHYYNYTINAKTGQITNIDIK